MERNFHIGQKVVFVTEFSTAQLKGLAAIGAIFPKVGQVCTITDLGVDQAGEWVCNIAEVQNTPDPNATGLDYRCRNFRPVKPATAPKQEGA